MVDMNPLVNDVHFGVPFSIHPHNRWNADSWHHVRVAEGNYRCNRLLASDTPLGWIIWVFVKFFFAGFPVVFP